MVQGKPTAEFFIKKTHKQLFEELSQARAIFLVTVGGDMLPLQNNRGKPLKLVLEENRLDFKTLEVGEEWSNYVMLVDRAAKLTGRVMNRVASGMARKLVFGSALFVPMHEWERMQ